MGSWLDVQYQAYVSSCDWALNPTRRPLVTPSHLCPYFTHGYLATLVVIIASSWVRLLMTLPPAACIKSSVTVKSSQLGRSSMVSTTLTSSCPVTKACGAFNNGVILSSSGARTVAIAYIVLWISSTALTNNSGRDITYLALGF